MIPFFGFRIMVGMGLIMLAVSWFGNFLRLARPAGDDALVSLGRRSSPFPTGFIAILTGWFTAEVGRQPWVVYGLLRTKDAVTPSLTTGDVLFSLAGYVLVYAVFVSFGVYYIYKLLREGPTGDAKADPGRHGQPADGVRRHAPTRPPAAVCGPAGERHGTEQSGVVLGRRHRLLDPGLRHPGRLRSRRRHAVRHHAERGAPSRR